MKYANYKILVVDDDNLHRVTLRSIIRKELNASVWEASDPLKAFDVLQRSMPDLILLDVQMPYLDGKSALEKIRAAQQTRAIPVIMCTAVTDRNVVLGLLQLGVSDYIVKPYKTEEVAQKIKKVLDKLHGSPR